MLADVSGEEVEAYMLSNNLVGQSSAQTDVPTDRGCTDEEHEKMRQEQEGQGGQPIRFF